MEKKESTTKKIAVLGSGFVSKPAVDYFLDRCGYEVVVTSLKKSEAEKIIGGRPGGRAVAWSQEQHEILDNIVGEVDLVMSMIPPTMHFSVAEACLKHRKDMVIVQAELAAEFGDRREQRSSTLLVHGEPGGDSAMSKAVSLPAAIASKLILQGKIMTKGVQRPTLPEIYRPVLKEMEDFGYIFANKTLECRLLDN